MTLQAILTALVNTFGADIKAINTALAGMGGSITQIDINAAIASLRNELRGGAGAALDTFIEIEARLGQDAGTVAALATAIAARVRFDEAQVLTPVQRAFARSNIGAQESATIGDPTVDLVALYNAAKA